MLTDFLMDVVTDACESNVDDELSTSAVVESICPIQEDEAEGESWSVLLQQSQRFGCERKRKEETEIVQDVSVNPRAATSSDAFSDTTLMLSSKSTASSVTSEIFEFREIL